MQKQRHMVAVLHNAIMEDFHLCFDRQSTHLLSQLYMLEISVKGIIVSKRGKALGATRYLKLNVDQKYSITVQTIHSTKLFFVSVCLLSISRKEKKRSHHC